MVSVAKNDRKLKPVLCKHRIKKLGQACFKQTWEAKKSYIKGLVVKVPHKRRKLFRMITEEKIYLMSVTCTRWNQS